MWPETTTQSNANHINSQKVIFFLGLSLWWKVLLLLYHFEQLFLQNFKTIPQWSHYHKLIFGEWTSNHCHRKPIYSWSTHRQWLPCVKYRDWGNINFDTGSWQTTVWYIEENTSFPMSLQYFLNRALLGKSNSLNQYLIYGFTSMSQ